VIEVSGHNFRALNEAVEEAQAQRHQNEKPTVIIAHTIPGKGVHEFERNYKWHGYDPVAKNAKEDLY
jgi:transketolase